MTSRRSFLVRTGVGGALLVVPPWLRLPLAFPRSPNALPGDLPEGLLSGLEWRLLGPFRGGRVDAVCGVPGRPNEFYFGHV
ncbi:MAG TPA: twin-arginine translocation signal domain-containing protein, partial [Gemmatimonadales bacterium]